MDWITLRLVERILVVLFGGMAIYLGYRLFLKVPQSQESEGRFTFPHDISIVLVRIGPGIFFALFGAAILGASFLQGIELGSVKKTSAMAKEAAEKAGSSPQVTLETLQFKGAAAPMTASEPEARDDARRLLRKEIAILNTIPKHLKPDLPEQDRVVVELAIPRIKFALMKAMWWSEPVHGWGDAAAFEKWIESREPMPPPPELKNAVEYYRYPQPVKP